MRERAHVGTREKRLSHLNRAAPAHTTLSGSEFLRVGAAKKEYLDPISILYYINMSVAVLKLLVAIIMSVLPLTSLHLGSA